MFPPPPVAPAPTDITNRPTLPWVTFTPTEIKQAIFTFEPRKAPGPDGHLFYCLWQAYLAATEQFNSLFAVLRTTGYHPTCWRQATTVIIPKPRKPDYSIPMAYRPVALLNCLGKTLEKLMANRIAYMAEKYNLLHKDQIGGQRQCSAIDAAMALTHEIEQGKHTKKITTALFMAVSGVFDNVSKDSLLQTQ